MIANGQRVVLNDTFAATQMTHYLNREIKKTNTSALIIKKQDGKVYLKRTALHRGVAP